MRLRLYVNWLCCVFVPIVRDLLCMSARDVSFEAIENKKVLEVVQDRIIEIDIKFSDDKSIVCQKIRQYRSYRFLMLTHF